MKIANFEKAEWIDAWRDRVPMTEDEVLVTFQAKPMRRRGFDDDDVIVKNFITVTQAFYDTEEGHWSINNVLAWMPLPEPYNPVEEE